MSNKYSKEYIVEKMADFNDFRSALRDLGYAFSIEIEIKLYAMWKR